MPLPLRTKSSSPSQVLPAKSTLTSCSTGSWSFSWSFSGVSPVRSSSKPSFSSLGHTKLATRTSRLISTLSFSVVSIEYNGSTSSLSEANKVEVNSDGVGVVLALCNVSSGGRGDFDFDRLKPNGMRVAAALLGRLGIGGRLENVEGFLLALFDGMKLILRFRSGMDSEAEKPAKDFVGFGVFGAFGARSGPSDVVALTPIEAAPTVTNELELGAGTSWSACSRLSWVSDVLAFGVCSSSTSSFSDSASSTIACWPTFSLLTLGFASGFGVAPWVLLCRVVGIRRSEEKDGIVAALAGQCERKVEGVLFYYARPDRGDAGQVFDNNVRS